MEEKSAVFDEKGLVQFVNSESELRKYLKSKSEEELRKQIAIHSVIVGNQRFLSGGEPTSNVKQAIAFFQMELDHRAARQAENLAKK